MTTVNVTITGPVQFTRGLKANLPTTALPGQAFFCTDTGEVFVWNGTAMVGPSAAVAAEVARAQAAEGALVQLKAIPYRAAALSVSTPIVVNTTIASVVWSGINQATGKLYGVKVSNGHFATSVDGGTTVVDQTYSPSVFTPNVIAFEFDSTYMYAYTSDGKIFRAPLDTFNSWTNVSAPTPAATTGRPGSLCAVGSGVLLYGNYNADAVTPPGNVGAHVYRSTNAGASWTEVLTIAGGRHVHAIRVSSVTGYAWVTVGDAGYVGRGLYKSMDNGATWTYMSSNIYGIDMVFAPGSGHRPGLVVLEGDGSNQPHLMAFPENGLPGDNTYPLVPFSGAPGDVGTNRGTVRGIGLTPNGDVVYFTTTEGGGVGTHAGIYIAQAPDFANTFLLKDTTGAEPVFYAHTVFANGLALNYAWNFTIPIFENCGL